MTDHNARQAGLTVAERTTIQAAKRLADSMGNTWLSSDLETILATHSADARNGEGVALTDEIAERVSKMRNALYAIAQSDPNGYAYELRVIATKAWEESLTLAAPAAPAPTQNRDTIMRDVQSDADHLGIGFYLTRNDGSIQYLPAHQVTILRKATPAPAAQADIESLLVTLGVAGIQVNGGTHGAPWTVKLPQQSATPAEPAPSDRQGDVECCNTCGGTGDVRDMNGEWRGFCWCGARSKLNGGKSSRTHDVPYMPANTQEAKAYVLGLEDSATPECTCPSGSGSLRHPCPVHSVDAASEAIYLAKLRNGMTTWLEFTAEAWAKLDSTWIRCKADAASEADKRDLYPQRLLHESDASLAERVDLWHERRVQRERQQGADRG